MKYRDMKRADLETALMTWRAEVFDKGRRLAELEAQSVAAREEGACMPVKRVDEMADVRGFYVQACREVRLILEAMS